MRKRSFGEFLDKKKRDSIRQLGILKQALESRGMKVENFLHTDDHEPYIFCHNTTKNGSFDGVRIYKVGDEICMRIQKESKTHPYGSAYPLPVESMFYDFMTDHGVDERKAGMKIIDSLNKEIRRFFDKSVEAERDVDPTQAEKDMDGNMLVRGSGTDYSALLMSKSS